MRWPSRSWRRRAAIPALRRAAAAFAGWNRPRRKVSRSSMPGPRWTPRAISSPMAAASSMSPPWARTSARRVARPMPRSAASNGRTGSGAAISVCGQGPVTGGREDEAMSRYRAPIADIAHVLKHVAGLDQVAGRGRFDGVDEALALAVIEEAGRFAAERIVPLRPVGDRHGVRLENGA